jgi:hypothetical protein
MKMWLKKNTAAEFRNLSSLRIGPMGLPWQNGYRPFHICWKYLQLDQGGRLDKRYYLPDLDALRKQPHVYKSALNSPIFEEEPPPAEKLICESRCEAPDNPTREVPNPACGAMDPQLCQARGRWIGCKPNTDWRRLSPCNARAGQLRGFKIAQGEQGQKIRNVWQRELQLESHHAAMPRRAPV